MRNILKITNHWLCAMAIESTVNHTLVCENGTAVTINTQTFHIFIYSIFSWPNVSINHINSSSEKRNNVFFRIQFIQSKLHQRQYGHAVCSVVLCNIGIGKFILIDAEMKYFYCSLSAAFVYFCFFPTRFSFYEFHLFRELNGSNGQIYQQMIQMKFKHNELTKDFSRNLVIKSITATKTYNIYIDD